MQCWFAVFLVATGCAARVQQVDAGATLRLALENPAAVDAALRKTRVRVMGIVRGVGFVSEYSVASRSFSTATPVGLGVAITTDTHHTISEDRLPYVRLGTKGVGSFVCLFREGETKELALMREGYAALVEGIFVSADNAGGAGLVVLRRCRVL